MRSIAKLSVSIGTRRSACRCFVNVGSPLIVAGIRVAHIVESIAAKERRIFPESPLGKALQRIRDENASQKSGQGKKPIRPCARMNQGRRALFPNLFMLRAIRKIERLPKKEDYRADRKPWGRGAGCRHSAACKKIQSDVVCGAASFSSARTSFFRRSSSWRAFSAFTFDSSVRLSDAARRSRRSSSLSSSSISFMRAL